MTSRLADSQTRKIADLGFECNLDIACTSEFLKDLKIARVRGGRVLFEVFEKLTSACLSKFHEKPCYYLLIIYIKVFETIAVLTSRVYSEYSTGKVFLALLYHIIQR